MAFGKNVGSAELWKTKRWKLALQAPLPGNASDKKDPYPLVNPQNQDFLCLSELLV